jgi:hypothetical protein
MASPIVYTVVAHESVVLAEYTDNTGSFVRLARQLLDKISPTVDTKRSYTTDK